MQGMDDALFCAKYPFTSSARERVAAKKMELAKIPVESIERAKLRVMQALRRGELPRFIDVDNISELELEAYAVSRILLSIVGNRYFINRYAVAESKRASTYLREDSEANILRAAKEIGIGGEKKGADYLVPFVDYLLFSPGAKEYKLTNQPLRSGFIRLDKHKFTRLMEESVKQSIEKSLPFKIPNIPPALKLASDSIRADAKGLEPVYEIKFKSGEFPQCIQNLIDKLKHGENLNHTSRWALAVFMLNAGYSVEEIAKLYSYAPDYDPRITEYQIEHAKKKGYKMPTCEWMRTYGIGCEPRCGKPTPIAHISDKKNGMKK
jgi:DNA primase large subunit